MGEEKKPRKKDGLEYICVMLPTTVKRDLKDYIDEKHMSYTAFFTEAAKNAGKIVNMDDKGVEVALETLKDLDRKYNKCMESYELLNAKMDIIIKLLSK